MKKTKEIVNEERRFLRLCSQSYRDKLGKRKIKDIKISDAKMWFVELQNDGRGYSSINNIRGVVRPAFQMAVDDDLLLKNPFNFKMQDVIKNDSQKRISVTPEQQERFLEFIQADKHYGKYYDAVYICSPAN